MLEIHFLFPQIKKTFVNVIKTLPFLLALDIGPIGY